jgi:hypothetical protein
VLLLKSVIYTVVSKDLGIYEKSWGAGEGIINNTHLSLPFQDNEFNCIIILNMPFTPCAKSLFVEGYRCIKFGGWFEYKHVEFQPEGNHAAWSLWKTQYASSCSGWAMAKDASFTDLRGETVTIVKSEDKMSLQGLSLRWLIECGLGDLYRWEPEPWWLAFQMKTQLVDGRLVCCNVCVTPLTGILKHLALTMGERSNVWASRTAHRIP